MPILQIIERVAATSSKNEKVAILSAEKDNQLLKDVLVACYDPTINYWIKKIPDTDNLIACDKLPAALKSLELITTRKVTGHAAIKQLELILSSLDGDDGEIIRRIVLRDMRAGFSASTINKVWKNLIKESPYCRCSLPKELKGKNTLDHWPWGQGVPVQLKADGMFIKVNNYTNGDVVISSRNGSLFDNERFQPLFIGELRKYIPIEHQTHGEVVVYQAGKLLPREVGNGIMNSVLKGGEFPTGAYPLYLVWDMIPIVCAVPGGKCHEPYHDRFTKVCDALNNKSGYIKIIETRIVNSLEQAMTFYSQCLAEGLEGAVLKHPMMIWEDTTSRGQVKLKLEFQVELEVVGKVEGKGKFVGMLGALECKSSCGKLVVNVPGFTDKQRKEFWDSDEFIKVGDVIQVKANNVTQDNGLYSLFLPGFQEIRLDKSEADSLERILTIYENAIRP